MELKRNEDKVNNLSSFSQSLGTLFGQMGGYSIIQLIASFIMVAMTVGMLISVAMEGSMSEIFEAMQTSICSCFPSKVSIAAGFACDTTRQ